MPVSTQLRQGDGELISQDYVVEVKVTVAYIMRCCLKATKQKTYYVYSWQGLYRQNYLVFFITIYGGVHLLGRLKPCLLLSLDLGPWCFEQCPNKNHLEASSRWEQAAITLSVFVLV